MLDFLNKGENFILDWTGIILVLLGGGGLLFTIAFDQIARKESVSTFGWLQVTGILCFIGLILFGACVQMFLGQIIEILKEYVKK